MGDPATLLLGSLASWALPEVIKLVINCTQAAVKCRSECKRLHEELVLIKPDVESIEKRLALLRAHHCDAHEDLQMVQLWLQRLKDVILIASSDVHKCNSGRFSFDQHKLSVRLTSQYNTITKLGQQRQSLFMQLRHLMPHVMAHPPQGRHESPVCVSQYHCDSPVRAPQNWHESPGTSVLQRMADERNDALLREDRYRQSMNASSILHYGYVGYQSEESSTHGGYQSRESSTHGGYQSKESSGHGSDSPGTPLLRQMSTQRNENLQGEEQHRQVEAQRLLLRRHTLASAYGHDVPAYDKWKY